MQTLATPGHRLIEHAVGSLLLRGPGACGPGELLRGAAERHAVGDCGALWHHGARADGREQYQQPELDCRRADAGNLRRHGRRLVPALDQRHHGAGHRHQRRSVVYVVRVGDTLSAIGNRYGVGIQSLASLNALGAPYIIRTGQTLLIPATSDSPAAAVTQPAVAVSAPPAAPVTGGIVYAVAQGDSLSALSNRFGVTVEALAAANHISLNSLITIGQQLVIPAAGSGSAHPRPCPARRASPPPPCRRQTGSYVVQAGDTLSAIAQRYGMTTDALAAQNNMATSAIIAVGRQLTVPANALVTAGGQEPFVDKATIASILTAEAQRVGIDPALVKALAWQESGWQMVTASDGGMGVMQLMPDSVTWAGGTLLGQTIDPFNATDNIRAGVAMLSYYLKVYDGDARKALAAYHQGMASVDNEGIRPDTEQYIANILSLQQQYGG